MKTAITMTMLVLAMSACATNNKGEVLTISEKNTVSLNLPIVSSTASRVNRELLEKSRKLKDGEPIYLVLNTPGGSIDDGLKIIEVAKSLPRPVHTISLFNASMGFIIAQYLDNRYVLESSTMMSHRAFVGGIRGEYPGSLISRFMAIGNQLMGINSKVATRAGLPLMKYLDLTANELWMGSEQAIQLKFADKEIVLRCDNSLQGAGPIETLDLGLFAVNVKFNKCPLITEPTIVSGDSAVVNSIVNDKIQFLKKYDVFLR